MINKIKRLKNLPLKNETLDKQFNYTWKIFSYIFVIICIFDIGTSINIIDGVYFIETNFLLAGFINNQKYFMFTLFYILIHSFYYIILRVLFAIPNKIMKLLSVYILVTLIIYITLQTINNIHLTLL